MSCQVGRSRRGAITTQSGWKGCGIVLLMVAGVGAVPRFLGWLRKGAQKGRVAAIAPEFARFANVSRKQLRHQAYVRGKVIALGDNRYDRAFDGGLEILLHQYAHVGGAELGSISVPYMNPRGNTPFDRVQDTIPEKLLPANPKEVGTVLLLRYGGTLELSRERRDGPFFVRFPAGVCRLTFVDVREEAIVFEAIIKKELDRTFRLDARPEDHRELGAEMKRFFARLEGLRELDAEVKLFLDGVRVVDLSSPMPTDLVAKSAPAPAEPPVPADVATPPARGEGGAEKHEGKPAAPAGFTNSIGMKMVRVSEGMFEMGSPAQEKQRGADEGPVRLVRIARSFHMSAHEITQQQYEKVMGANPSRFKNGPTYPVEKVSWEDAVGFCKKLSAMEGRTYRLPTEAEWEYVCRAGSTGAFCFGDADKELADHGWYDENGRGTTHPVGERRPNAWGVYDMHGNVWEWCQDGYRPYDEERQKAPVGTRRVLRGGCWRDGSRACRSANRYKNRPASRSSRGGFRVVLSDARAAPANPAGPGR